MYMLAGQDTSANTMSFAILLLALHGDCQTKLQEQLDKQLAGRHPEHWTMQEDFGVLSGGYLGAVLKETLRAYNVVGWNAKHSVRDTTVTTSSGEAVHIPADTMVILGFAAAYQNPHHFSPGQDSGHPALSFNPDRWLKTEQDVSVPNALFMPFGSGPRACPGRRFAEYEMCAVLAYLFHFYRVELTVSRHEALQALQGGLSQNATLTMGTDLPFRLVDRGKGTSSHV